MSFILLTEVINLNKNDFACTDDIQEAIGPILSELDDDKMSESFIGDLCEKFLNILIR